MQYDYLKKVVQEGSVFLLVCYVSGFIAWNTYLSYFGFFEYDLLQTRFLSAGFLILFLPLLILVFSDKAREHFKGYNIFRQILFFFIWVIFFSQFVFPNVPQYWGGARPYVVSFITNSEISESFKLMGMSLQEKNDKSVETLKSCKIYENKEIIIAGFVFLPTSTTTPSYVEIQAQPNRTLIINRDEVEAQSVLPQIDIFNQIACDGIRVVYGADLYAFIRQTFLMKGFYEQRETTK